MAPQPGPEYFRRTGLGAVTAISLGLGLYTAVVLAPKSIPYESLGFFGSFLQYLTVNHYGKLYFGYYLTWIIHGVEALYTYKLAGDKGLTSSTRLKWSLQTLLFGIFSLKFLNAYQPPKPKRG
ncbi:transmembrane protein 254 [Petromyzon marinus]|uniref:Transmembrane protein 254 n=1 Tax=Petromyzon marinus TaxID=7757 RepID=A0AAJ7TDZ0_PETMA|nr:transmembrane protein 254 isoform X2 [Petromyzon marinus]